MACGRCWRVLQSKVGWTGCWARLPPNTEHFTGQAWVGWGSGPRDGSVTVSEGVYRMQSLFCPGSGLCVQQRSPHGIVPSSHNLFYSCSFPTSYYIENIQWINVCVWLKFTSVLRCKYCYLHSSIHVTSSWLLFLVLAYSWISKLRPELMAVTGSLTKCIWRAQECLWRKWKAIQKKGLWG